MGLEKCQACSKPVHVNCYYSVWSHPGNLYISGIHIHLLSSYFPHQNLISKIFCHIKGRKPSKELTSYVASIILGSLNMFLKVI